MRPRLRISPVPLRLGVLILLCLAWLGGIPCAQAQTGPALQWGAQSSALGHVIGRADSGGWSANVAQDAANFLQYGPYTTSVAAGAQTTYWSLLIDNNTATGDGGPVLELQVSDYTKNNTLLAVHDVNRHDFTAANQYQTFALPFTLPTADVGDHLEFRVYWYSKAYIREQTVSLLGPPTSLTATPGNAIVSLAWTAAPGATSYNVYRATVSGGPYTKVNASAVTVAAYTDSGLTSGTTYYYAITTVTAAGESAYSNVASATPTATGPAVAAAASASPNPVTGNTASLSVLGADTAGENTLTYTWSGPVGVSFSPNGTNASKNTTATFRQAGSEALTVTIKDTGGLAATSTVTVAVQQTATALAVTPSMASVSVGSTQAFAASVLDQFGAILSPQPGVAWSVPAAAGSISASGVFTASGSAGGPYVVTATGGAVSGTATVTLLPPLVNDTAGGITYTGSSWFYSSGRGVGDYQDDVHAATANGDSLSYAFTGTGVDYLDETCTDEGNVDVYLDGTLAQTVSAYSAARVSQVVLFSAHGLASGPHTIQLVKRSGSYMCLDAFRVYAAAPSPTVATAASATPNPVTGTTTSLSVLGADAAGEGTLTYTWAATGTPPAPVTFSANGTNASKNATATFSKAGSYGLTVTIKDGSGLTATSSVAVTVSQTATTVTVSPPATVLPVGGTANYAATVTDQFGAPMVPPPSVTWGVPAAAGTISASGVFAAASAPGGPFTVTATAGGASGTASVSLVTGAPTGLAANPGNGQIVLTWNAVAGATGYNVYRSTTSGGPYTKINTSVVASALYTDMGLTNGTTYYYVVTALSAGGVESGYSNPASATPSASAVLSPSALAASTYPGATSISLSWTAVTGATSYNLYRATSPGGEGATPYQSNIAPYTVPSYTDPSSGSGLTSGQTYYYQVTAVINGVESGRSNEASATVGAAPLPAPVLTGVAAATSNTLTWSAVAGATSYNLYQIIGDLRYSDGGDGNGYIVLYRTGLTNQSFTDPGLTAGTLYGYYVCAVNASGQGTLSNYVYLTPGSTALTAPSLAATTSSGQTYTYLNWSPVTGATSYDLYRSATAGGEGAIPYQVNIPSYGFTENIFTDPPSGSGLPAGTTYYYKVVAVGPGGEGALSNEASATVGAAPLPAPTGLTATGAPGGVQAVLLTWNAVAGATSYNLYQVIGRGEEYGILYRQGLVGTSFADTGAIFGPSYTYYLCAANASGQGGPSNETTALLYGFGLAGNGASPYAGGSDANVTPSVTVTRGTVGAVSIVLAPSGGYGGPVAFSMSGLPAGVNAWTYGWPLMLPPFNPPGWQIGQPSQGPGGVIIANLYLAVSAAAPLGTYTFQVTGTSTSGDGFVNTAPVTLTIN